MRTIPMILSNVAAILGLGSLCAAQSPIVRPPAVPLVTHDPYTSCWSMADRLYDDWPKHWTGRTHAMCGIIRVDGVPMRFMGPASVLDKAVQQTGLTVQPTQTLYRFSCQGVDLEVTFTSPLLPDDLEICSRPASYITFAARSNDGKPHSVQIYFDATAEWAVHDPRQEVEWSRMDSRTLDLLRVGTVKQEILVRKGDNVAIDWGYLMVAAKKDKAFSTIIDAADPSRTLFIEKGRMRSTDDRRMPRAAEDRWPVLAVGIDLETVKDDTVRKHIVIGYDDVRSIEYMGTPLAAWWRRGADASPVDMMEQAEADYDTLMQRCAAFDARVTEATRKAGGEDYAALCALAYRQAMAGNKLVASPSGKPFLFPKENFSNGCIGTVDVIYPQAPVFLWLNPVLAEATLRPILEYAASPRWKFPFAPHDLGTYPKANGQVYGGGEKTEENQMQVEESGNMLILMAALAKRQGRADLAIEYWPLMQKWAQYLKERGLDPENQLCTDDFTGHLAHNVNLSAKAICGLAAYGMLCDMTGRKEEAEEYRTMAKTFAATWVGKADDGDHYRLAFDKPGTWSQKYNLVWDQILGFGLFPPEVREKEIAFYKKNQNTFGLPLDNRATYTKTDWLVWVASLTRTQEDFAGFVKPITAFLNQTPDRVPLTDWYDTITAAKKGFQARPVVGGVFIKMLLDTAP